MAKVIIPSENLKLFKSFGQGFSLSHREFANTVRYIPKPVFSSQESKELIIEEYDAITKSWQGLTEEQRAEWEELALNIYDTGFNLFKRESLRGSLSSIYAVGVYGQNVYVPL